MKLYNGDCLDIMQDMPSKSIDCIITDLPYGTQACNWDVVLPLAAMWSRYKRIIKPNAPIVLFGSQPFTSILIMSNVDQFKYCWHWKKSRPSGFTNAKLRPLKDIEDICVFSTGATANGAVNMPYYPQGLIKVDKEWSRPKTYVKPESKTTPARENSKLNRVLEFENYPRQILEFSNGNKGVLHETQKPLDLMEYLVKTYTLEGQTILDSCMGSGTTGLAAKNLNRHFIGIEKNEKYFNIAKERLGA